MNVEEGRIIRHITEAERLLKLVEDLHTRIDKTLSDDGKRDVLEERADRFALQAHLHIGLAGVFMPTAPEPSEDGDGIPNDDELGRMIKDMP